MRPKVYVMMSTYNGEKYISEQLDSILAQKHVDVCLAIRDDGSHDNTLEILNEYENKYKNINVYHGKNIGYAASFWTLLLSSPNDYDYYAFADQDDIWEKNKLAAGIQALKSNENDKLKLYASALNVMDEDMNFQYINEFKRLRSKFGSAVTRPRLSGCTMIFNSSLLSICKKMDLREKNGKCISHDALVYISFLACGGRLTFSRKSYINLRRHPETVTGHGKSIFKRVSSVLDIFTSRKNEALKQVTFIYENINDCLTDENRRLCMDIINYRSSLNSTLRLCFDKRIKCGLLSVDLTNFFAILFHCY